MLLGGIARAEDASAPPIPTVALGGDWVVVEESPREIVLRHGRTADGARITLAETEEGHRVGVAPIVDGRTLAVDDATHSAPAFGWPLPEHPLTAVTIEVQGPDLLVRMEGPPIARVTDHPDAPQDPVISWVRLRPRGDTWRIALRGVHRVSLPPGTASVNHASRRTLDTTWGQLEIVTDAPAIGGHVGTFGTVWDTRPSIDLAQPYPRTGITLTP